MKIKRVVIIVGIIVFVSISIGLLLYKISLQQNLNLNLKTILTNFAKKDSEDRGNFICVGNCSMSAGNTALNVGDNLICRVIMVTPYDRPQAEVVGILDSDLKDSNGNMVLKRGTKFITNKDKITVIDTKLHYIAWSKIITQEGITKELNSMALGSALKDEDFPFIMGTPVLTNFIISK